MCAIAAPRPGMLMTSLWILHILRYMRIYVCLCCCVMWVRTSALELCYKFFLWMKIDYPFGGYVHHPGSKIGGATKDLYAR